MPTPTSEEHPPCVLDKVRTKGALLFMRFRFDDGKNHWLRRERNVTFDEVIQSISDNGILADYDHPNQQKYPMQRILVVNIHGYPHCVPYSLDGDTIEMKTVYPSRRLRFLIKGETDE